MSENTQAAPAAQGSCCQIRGQGAQHRHRRWRRSSPSRGLALWGMQLSGGLVQTGMRNFDSWGLYITMFMFLVGLSAGGLIISVGAARLRHEGLRRHLEDRRVDVHLLHGAGRGLRGDRPRPAGFACGSCSRTRTWARPLMWDIVGASGTYLILSIVYLWATLRFEGGKVSERSLRVISRGRAASCAILVHSVTAWIFGLQQSPRDVVHGASARPWFVSSALVCGTALVLVVVIALRQGRATSSSTRRTS